MNVQIENCAGLPPREEWESILREYYGWHVAKMAEIGFSIADETVENAIAEYRAETAAYLPPLGQTLLARTDSGTLVGCGTLKRIGHDLGELKRLYVKPEARGFGLGRRLVEARIETARRMGLKKLIVDSLRHSKEMYALYKSLGFREVAPNYQSATAKLDADLVAHTVFFEFDLVDV